jgi:hypothetical protein
MGQLLPLRRHGPVFISTATPRELFERLAQCKREIGQHEGVVDADQTFDGKARESYRLLDILRCEAADLEAAWHARFAGWAGMTLDEAAGVLL